MQLEFIILADAVTISGGKFNVLGGGITQINTHTLPATHLMLSALVRVQLEPADVGLVQLKWAITDPSGEEIFEAENKGEITHQTDNPDKVALNFVLSVVNTELKRQGEYSLRVTASDEELAVAKFRVNVIG